MPESWPEIPYADWRETLGALHLYAQIVGKYRLARTPWVNHSWHATFYVTGRGLTTGPVPDGGELIHIQFDLVDHRLVGHGSNGRVETFPLEAGTVASFRRSFVAMLEALGASTRMSRRPSEIADGIPFDEDEAQRPYDRGAVERFHKALTVIAPVLERFRTGFLGKVSPVHLFWGSFDLNVTRYSGRPAPLHPGGMVGLPDAVMQEAESHENFSAGFWPGGGASGIEYPAFYAYAYPGPEGLAERKIEPEGAMFVSELGEFLLPYDAVRTAPNPAEALMRFLQTSYEAAADLGGWDRKALECALGEPLKPRLVS